MAEAIQADAELPDNTKEANAEASPTENDGANPETPGCVQAILFLTNAQPKPERAARSLHRRHWGFFGLFLMETWKFMTQSALNGCIYKKGNTLRTFFLYKKCNLYRSCENFGLESIIKA